MQSILVLDQQDGSRRERIGYGRGCLRLQSSRRYARLNVTYRTDWGVVKRRIKAHMSNLGAYVQRIQPIP